MPRKIWKDCMHCTKFTGCDEVAVIRAVSPTAVVACFPLRGPPASGTRLGDKGAATMIGRAIADVCVR